MSAYTYKNPHPYTMITTEFTMYKSIILETIFLIEKKYLTNMLEMY